VRSASSLHGSGFKPIRAKKLAGAPAGGGTDNGGSSGSTGGSSGGSSGGSGGGSSCNVPGIGAGTCMSTTDCANQGGDSTPGHCPGAADIECCTGAGAGAGAGPDTGDGSSSGTGTGTGSGSGSSTCDVPGLGSGICMPTVNCAAVGGTSTPDYCPGAADIQCCTP
jgi:hypothetical protein